MGPIPNKDFVLPVPYDRPIFAYSGAMASLNSIGPVVSNHVPEIKHTASLAANLAMKRLLPIVMESDSALIIAKR